MASWLYLLISEGMNSDQCCEAYYISNSWHFRALVSGSLQVIPRTETHLFVLSLPPTHLPSLALLSPLILIILHALCSDRICVGADRLCLRLT